MRSGNQPVDIRTAEGDDLRSCLALDDSYVATHTWQVESVRGEPGAAPYSMQSTITLGDSPLSVTFRPVKLPRARRVLGQVAASLREGNEVSMLGRLQQWEAADLVLVAEQGSKMCGYIVVTVVPSSGIGWVNALVVANSLRRQGIGSMLLAAARRWARYGQGNVRAFMLELSPKNYPAVAFCRKEGFNFCGYTDYSFSNGEIVLLFVNPVVI
ncbi:MAG: GNAT family N-acetyltransferase [Chloroflexota bacterium]